MADPAEQDVTQAADPTGGNPAHTAADPANPAPAEAPAADADGSAKLDAPKDDAKPVSQAEIDRIVHNRVERERRARERAEIEADTLRKLVVPTKEPAPAKADERPKQADFDVYEDYLRADARYEARLAVREEREAEQRQQQEQKQQQSKASVHERFGAALEKAGDVSPQFYDNYDKVARLQYAEGTDYELHDAIADSDRASELLVYLASNLVEAQRIAALSPKRAVMELGKIEATLGAPKKVAVSNAPAPIAPVGTTRASVSADAITGQETTEEYARKRLAQMAQGRR